MAWTDMTQLTNCYAWYKPESLSSAYGNGDPITSWADSSGNSRDVSQSDSARQPLATANAFGTYMAADFDGSNDYLDSASYTQSGDVVVTIVCSLDILKNYNSLYGFDAQSPPSWNAGTPSTQWNTALCYNNGYLNLVQNDGAYKYYSTQNFTPCYLSASTFYLLSFCTSGLSRFIRIGGAAATAGALSGTPTTPSTSTAHVALGWNGLTNGFLNGKIVEFVAYDAVSKECPEMHWVEGYLADKYSMTLPSGHLFKNDPPANSPTTYNPTVSPEFHPLG
jgi:hypothetical protein